MILKTKRLQNTKTPQTVAGQKQEQNVAFFLRRAYKDHKQVLVINDFKFTFNDEIAQIDHLIIYPYGFVLIESKSIKGHVKVNKQGEWTRSHSSQWQGMASPIKQVELQQALLKELLRAHKSEILSKLLGIKQQGFNMRCWDQLCAISSDAVIDRNTMTAAISDKLVKSEFLVEKLDKLMKIRNRVIMALNFTDTRPDFSQTELDSISSFLLGRHIENRQIGSQQIEAPITPPTLIEPATIQPHTPQYQHAGQYSNRAQPNTHQLHSELRCKHCGESTNYTPMHGKFGYYIKCNLCTKNTPMKQACPQCQSKSTKVQKRKETYTLNCQECGSGQRVV